MNRKLKRQLQIVDHFKNAENTAAKNHYELNKQKSLLKKLKTTERNEIKIEKTGGEFKFEFNTGFYEIFRSELEKFFSQLDYPYKCIRIPVTNKKGNITENICKIYDNIGHLYTVNLYHTQSSSLVNGKNSALFVQTQEYLNP